MSATAPRPATGPNRTTWWVLGAVAVLVVAVFVVVAATGGGNDEDQAASSGAVEVAPVTITGDPLPPFPDGPGVPDPATDPAVGQAAPVVEGAGFDGAPVTVGAADGTPTLVLFVAHWCPHCQREVPKVQELIDAGQVPEGVEVVAVSTEAGSDRDNWPPSAWLAEEGWSAPVLVDDADSSAAQAFGLTGFPYGVYLDGQGQVVARTTGEVDTAVVSELLGRLADS